MQDHDPDEQWDDSSYQFVPEMCSAITAAQVLLWKIAASNLAHTPKEVLCVGKMFQILQDLPTVREEERLRILLCGPTRAYGSHEISHSWEIELTEDGWLRITAGGYFSRPETGGDSFTTFMWEVSPGSEPDETDLSQAHPIVDDADTFENEVERMDLSEDGYSLETESSTLEEWENSIPGGIDVESDDEAHEL